MGQSSTARYSTAPTEHVHTPDGHGNINTGYSRQMDNKTSESAQKMRTTNDFSEQERVLNLLKPDSVIELLQQKHTCPPLIYTSHTHTHIDVVIQQHVGQVKLLLTFHANVKEKIPPLHLHAQLKEDYKYLPSVRIRIIQSCKGKLCVWCVCQPVCSDSYALVMVRLWHHNQRPSLPLFLKHHQPAHLSDPWHTSTCNKKPNAHGAVEPHVS